MPNPYWDILDAVRTHLTAPAIADLGTPEVCEVPWVLAGETPPLCFVCPTPEGERLAKQTFVKGAWWDYPVVVLLINAGNRTRRTGAETRLQTRYLVRQRLFVPTLGATSVHDVTCTPKAAADLQAALGANYIVSGFQMTYRQAESRAA